MPSSEERGGVIFLALRCMSRQGPGSAAEYTSNHARLGKWPNPELNDDPPSSALQGGRVDRGEWRPATPIQVVCELLFSWVHGQVALHHGPGIFF